ncbi:uncharacterized protein LOC117224216 [Megalopta genalis]|uniref:uncharacterized protein LOC117224216 n=1 Tax=Megalopta genalis TaxID=115081 RepID=UPI003FD3CCBF
MNSNSLEFDPLYISTGPIDERSKKIIIKTSKYKTTSSDEEEDEPRRKKQCTVVTDDVQDKDQIGTKLDKILEMLEKITESNICERLTAVETELKTMNELLRKNLDKESAINVQKPECLPLQTIQEVDNFENSSKEEYESVVTYFSDAGGYNLKVATSACFREAISDDLLFSYTWFGTDACQPLYKTKIVQAIYDAACKNKTFPKPTRPEFQEAMRVVLRTAKERARHKRHRQQPQSKPTNYWDQEEPGDQELNM